MKTGFVPFLPGSGSWWSAFRGPSLFSSSSGGNSKQYSSSAGGDILVQSISPRLSKTLNLSSIINTDLLNKIPSANVAITHDNEWCSIIRQGSTDLYSSDFLRTVYKTNNFAYDRHVVFLVPKHLPGEEMSLTSHGDNLLTDRVAARPLSGPSTRTRRQRYSRLMDSLRAREVSQEIDAQIQREAEQRTKTVKVLILGQRKSGKATLIKHRSYAPTVFEQERTIWANVIQLKVLRFLRVQLEQVANTDSDIAGLQSSPEVQSTPPEYISAAATMALQSQASNTDDGSDVSEYASDSESLFTSRHSELFSIPSLLSSVTTLDTFTPSKVENIKEHILCIEGAETLLSAQIEAKQTLRQKTLYHTLSRRTEAWAFHETEQQLRAEGTSLEQLFSDLRTHILPLYGEVLEREFLSFARELQDQSTLLWGIFSGSFNADSSPDISATQHLDNLFAPGYLPTDEEIMSVSVPSPNLYEYDLKIAPTEPSIPIQWKFISARPNVSWPMLVSEMDAMIFIAPVSTFDMVADHDPKINHLEYSVDTWKGLVSSPLLNKQNLILILNKCDILEQKLNVGIRFSEYVTSYKDRPNDASSVCDYLKRNFKSINKKHSKTVGSVYIFSESLKDLQSRIAFRLVETVNEAIMRNNLRASEVL